MSGNIEKRCAANHRVYFMKTHCIWAILHTKTIKSSMYIDRTFLDSPSFSKNFSEVINRNDFKRILLNRVFETHFKTPRQRSGVRKGREVAGWASAVHCTVLPV